MIGTFSFSPLAEEEIEESIVLEFNNQGEREDLEFDEIIDDFIENND